MIFKVLLMCHINVVTQKAKVPELGLFSVYVCVSFLLNEVLSVCSCISETSGYGQSPAVTTPKGCLESLCVK